LHQGISLAVFHSVAAAQTQRQNQQSGEARNLARLKIRNLLNTVPSAVDNDKSSAWKWSLGL
jgi:hypothetical protein